MTTTKHLKLARGLRVILDIILGGLIFVCAALVIWMSTFSLFARNQDITGTASIPVILGAGVEPRSEVSYTSNPVDKIRDVFLVDAEGTLTLETRSTYLIVVSNLAKLFYAAGLIYIFYLLRIIVKAIIDGDPFSSNNGRNIRRLGFSILAVGILGPLAEFIAANEIIKRLSIIDPILQPGPTFDAWTILITLFILLLAHIWSYGLELEHDRSLTI